MLVSTVYTFVHSKRTFTLYTFENRESYNSPINCYDSESDVYYSAFIDSELFRNKTIVFIDNHIVDWFDNKAISKKTSLSYDII